MNDKTIEEKTRALEKLVRLVRERDYIRRPRDPAKTERKQARANRKRQGERAIRKRDVSKIYILRCLWQYWHCETMIILK